LLIAFIALASHFKKTAADAAVIQGEANYMNVEPYKEMQSVFH
jgi:hypothetical protein